MKWYLQSMLRAPQRFVPSSIRALKRTAVRFKETNANSVLTQGISILQAIEKDGYAVSGKTVLELGTGWEPIMPILFYLKNALSIISVDRNRLLFPVSITRSAEFLLKRADRISKEIKIPVPVIESKLAVLKNGDLKTLLSAMKTDYRSPSDARHISQADNSVDIVFSHNVLEHIPPRIIMEIFIEFRRILAPNGRMCHMIDNTDHWAQHDTSITYANFLKFGDRLWNFFQINPLDYQNRMRHSEYLRLMEKTGFHLLRDESWTDESLIPVLQSMKIHPRFRSFSVIDNATLCTFVVAGK
jgi:SAM-dependent methyltransferase